MNDVRRNIFAQGLLDTYNELSAAVNDPDLITSYFMSKVLRNWDRALMMQEFIDLWLADKRDEAEALIRRETERFKAEPPKRTILDKIRGRKVQASRHEPVFDDAVRFEDDLTVLLARLRRERSEYEEIDPHHLRGLSSLENSIRDAIAEAKNLQEASTDGA